MSIYERTKRALGGTEPAKLLEENRAIVGPRAKDMSEAAQAAMDAFDKGMEPTAAQRAALETCIRISRPSTLCAPGALGNLEGDRAEVFPQWGDFGKKASKHLGAIGRLDRLHDPNAFGGPDYRHTGTGFLLRDDVVATNRHVLDQLSMGAMDLDKGMARFDVDKHHGHQAGTFVDVVGVLAVHDVLDLALLKIDPLDCTETRVPLKVEDDTATDEQVVCVIGHPGDDPRSPAFRELVYGGIYGVKRASPGEVIGGGKEIAFHDCRTLGGNSGSPVLDMASGAVVGIHQSGYFMFRNEAIRAPSVTKWVADALGG